MYINIYIYIKYRKYNHHINIDNRKVSVHDVLTIYIEVVYCSIFFLGGVLYNSYTLSWVIILDDVSLLCTGCPKPQNASRKCRGQFHLKT